jgi:3-oxoacyl-[acyl-carrier protein] reductase
VEICEQVAIITGSTKGIGYSIAKSLVQKGAAIVINGRNQEKLDQTIMELKSIGGRVTGLPGSVEDPETGKKLVDLAIEQFGKVTILINNAGIIHDQFSYKMTEGEFSEVIDVHVKGAFYCTKPFIQQVKLQGYGGHIINMTSDSGLEGYIGQINYSAAKAAINGMTWTLAKELKRDEIIVNAIAPAALTDMTRPYVERAKRKAAEKGVPLSPAWEIGTSDEVAAFITTLIEDRNLTETGAIFGVNGQKVVRWKSPVSEPYCKNGMFSANGNER